MNNTIIYVESMNDTRERERERESVNVPDRLCVDLCFGSCEFWIGEIICENKRWWLSIQRHRITTTRCCDEYYDWWLNEIHFLSSWWCFWSLLNCPPLEHRSRMLVYTCTPLDTSETSIFAASHTTTNSSINYHHYHHANYYYYHEPYYDDYYYEDWYYD